MGNNKSPSIGEYTLAYQFERVRVLIVEDNKPMLDIIKSLLQTFGVSEVYTARDGEEGYRVFCQCNPDLILADWMMFPVDGIEFCRNVRTRTDSPNRFVPIILMTGYSERKRVFKARDAGITEFLVKPFIAQDLYKRIVQIIERPRQFVVSEDFFGPDRRRRPDTAYTGPTRRKSDTASVTKETLIAQASSDLDELRRRMGLTKNDTLVINPDDEIDFV